MTMITPSYLGETIEYSSLHACRSTLEDPTHDGTTRGDVTLRLYPKGKRQSDQHLTAEAWFQFKNNPGERGLQFDLRIQENRDTTTHVLPENSL